MRGRLQAFWRRARRSAVLYGALGTLTRIGGNVLLLPLVLKRLSPEEMALWWVFVAWGAAAGLADFGFGQSLARVYSYLYAGSDDFDTEGLRAPPKDQQPNLPRLRSLHATVSHLYLRLSGVAAVLVAVGGSLFIIKPAQATTNPGATWACWILYVAAVSYNLGTFHWSIACQGVNRVREWQAAGFWSGMVYLGSAGCLLWLHCGLVSMAVATLLRGLVARWLYGLAYHQAVPTEPGEQPRLENEMLRKLWPNAWRFGLLSLGAYLTTQANVLLCSHLLGAETTASFGLTAQLGNFLLNFSALWLGVKWSEIAMLRSQGRLREMSVLFAHRVAWVMGSFIVGAVLLVVLGNRLLEWKGSHTRLLPQATLILFMVNLGLAQVCVQFGSLTFTENVVPFFKIGLFSGLAVFVLSAVLTPWLGVTGLILGPLLVGLACSTWYVPWRGFQGQSLSVREFVRVALGG